MDAYALLVVGQRRFVEPIVLTLSQRYRVVTCETRRDALEKLEAEHFDLIVLDLAAMRFDPLRFYEHVRQLNPAIPFLVIVKRESAPERLPEAREYLYHPVDTRRLQRVVKRILPSRSCAPLVWQGLALEEGGTLRWGEKCVTLRPKPAALLAFLMHHPEHTFTRSELMQHVWQTDFDNDTRVLQVQIHWVRKALAALDAPFEIRATRGVGYGLFARTTESDSNPS